jgi:hypothetical protein
MLKIFLNVRFSRSDSSCTGGRYLSLGNDAEELYATGHNDWQRLFLRFDGDVKLEVNLIDLYLES